MTVFHLLDKSQVISRNVLQVLLSVSLTTKLIGWVELSHYIRRDLSQPVQREAWSISHSVSHCGCLVVLISLVCPQIILHRWMKHIKHRLICWYKKIFCASTH